MLSESTLTELEGRRAELRAKYLRTVEERGTSTARGIHHAVLICSDVEQTIRFYQDLLGFPLVELVENRDYAGSTHFFFDVGNRTLLGFFDFPGLGLEPGIEAIGGVQHIAISARRDRWEEVRDRLDGGGGDLRRARPRHRGVDVLQGPRRHPDRAVERSVDVLRRPPARRVGLASHRSG